MSPLHGSRESYEDHWSVLAAVSADGVHVWPFDPTFPIDVRYLTSGIRRNVRPNRHDYFEVVYMCAGKGSLRVQDRVLEMRAGDLFVMGSTLYHSLEYHEGPQFTVAALFFSTESDPGRWARQRRIPDAIFGAGFLISSRRLPSEQSGGRSLRTNPENPRGTACDVRTRQAIDKDIPPR